LSPANSRIVTPEDKKELEWALARLRPSFDELAKWFIDPMRETRPSQAIYGYEKLWDLISSAFVGGSRGTVTVSGKNYVHHVQTQKMRDDRASAPAEVALLKAIVAERGDSPVEHPFKEADAILKNVNMRLESDEFPPVTVDAIYRRLKK
jgi:hypothetical protein